MTLVVVLENIVKARKLSLEVGALILDSVLNDQGIRYTCSQVDIRVGEDECLATPRFEERQMQVRTSVCHDVHMSLSFSASGICRNGRRKRKEAVLTNITASVYSAKIGKTSATFRIPEASARTPKAVNRYLYRHFMGKPLQSSRPRAYKSNGVQGLATITFPLNASSKSTLINDILRHCSKSDGHITIDEISDSLNRIGRIYADLSMYSEAKRYHLAALRLNFKNVSTMHEYARCHISAGDLDNACTILKSALHINQERHITFLMLAEAEYKRGNLDLAVEITKSAMFYKADLELVHKAMQYYTSQSDYAKHLFEELNSTVFVNNTDRSFINFILANTAEEEYLRSNPDARDFEHGGYIHWLIKGLDESRRLPGVKTLVGLQMSVNKWRHFRLRGRDVSVKINPKSAHPLRYCILRSEMKAPLSRVLGATRVDVIIPVYRGYEDTVRCIESVFSDKEKPIGRVIVIDDNSPDKKLTRWLRRQQRALGFVLLRNRQNLGFVASINRGILESKNDVVLLNSDTEVPTGWLRRLAAHAHSNDTVGTVTPLSNNATIFSYPAPGHTIMRRFSLEELNRAAIAANSGLSIEVPTAMGFAMYIKRVCLDDVGLFDIKAFGKGYGEENDFCMRAFKKGWLHIAACDTFVYHAGEVSFGPASNLKEHASRVLEDRHPEYNTLLGEWSDRNPLLAAKLSLTVQLLKYARSPSVLFVSHALGGGIKRHIDDIIRESDNTAQFLLLVPDGRDFRLHVPSIKDHPEIRISFEERGDLLEFLKQVNISRVHIHHIMGFDQGIQNLVTSLNVPIDFTVHDYYALCPRVTFFDPYRQSYCGEPSQQSCNECISRDFVNGASDILSWRLDKRWLFQKSERVICPSEDVLRRLSNYGLSDNTVLAPHI